MAATIMSSIKSFFSKQNSIVRAISALALSLVLLIWPGLIDKPLVLSIGAIMLIIAVIDVIRASIQARSAVRQEEKEEKPNAFQIIRRISLDSYFYFGGGLIFLIIPATILEVLMPAFGIILCISAVIQLVSCISIVKLLRKEPAGMWTCLLVPILTIGLCCFIFAYPFDTAGRLTFTGIVLLFYSISELARMIYFELKVSDSETASSTENEEEHPLSTTK